MKPVKKFSLRSHDSSITALLPVENQVISGDSQGDLVWWDLVKKRPIKKWKAHRGSIITLKKLYNGLILSHAKDHSLKLWDLTNVESCYAEVPINTLNFCNIDVIEGYLLCPSTIDSEKFDLYSLFESEKFELKRLLHNVDPYQLYKDKEDIDDEVNHLKRGKFGSMMKVMFTSINQFIIGYESGALITFNLVLPLVKVTDTQTRINKDCKVTVDEINQYHQPNPILSLTYNNQLISGSTGKSIFFHTDCKTIPSNHYGIQQLVTYDQLLIGLFWDGVIKIYDLTTNFELWKYYRKTERISKNEDNLKITQISILNLENNYQNTYKDLIRKKSALNGNLLVIGFGDGLIESFHL